jgi:hypothetical protein
MEILVARKFHDPRDAAPPNGHAGPIMPMQHILGQPFKD